MVALKRVRMDVEKDGFPVTCLRELKILQNTDHPNIVRLKDIAMGSSFDRFPNLIFLFERIEQRLFGI